jgi:hypothetical protein
VNNFFSVSLIPRANDPYGFAGKVQGISGNLEKPKTLAKAVFQTLLANTQTHGEVRRAFVAALCGSGSYPLSIMLRDYIPEITDFTDEEKTIMWEACEKNSQVSNADRVPETVDKAIGKPKKPAEAPPESDDVPF